ncbi:RIP metalloprotease RseP [Ferroacidibacillus organovorans]|uniref:Zinc metalloprotease n=1 Tax=Ferroacidibacillus organovorans TaxID=1765683 RepID=A0A1V4ES27_9BACL|nr:RIP metalloprotease RseP [Ferroacidibacillus organovorans]OPG15650.1 RIP metalloprotease RseP [Ferroacidibacillus organovorans]
MISWLFDGGVRTVLSVVIVFLILVTIHEFGHFIVAKKAGVLVPKFAIGFGPPIFKFGRGETEYSIRLLPLGGFVQLAGEIPQDTLFKTGEEVAVLCNASGEVTLIGEPIDVRGEQVVSGSLVAIDTTRAFTVTLQTVDGVHTYPFALRAYIANGKDRIPMAPPNRQMMQKPLFARMLIVFAGPLMNVILTIVLLSIVTLSVGTLSSPPQIASVEANSPASRAGIVPGDTIVSVGNAATQNWTQLVLAIETHPNKSLIVTVARNGHDQTITVTPEKRSNGMGFIGITPAVTHGLIPAIEGGFQQTVAYTQMIYQALGHLFTSRTAFVKDVGGPVKIVQVIGQQAQLGVLNLVNLTAVLSLNLAIFNLLPIPALDGSRLLFMLVEWIRGRPVDPRKEYAVHAIGFAILILFTVFRTYLDVTQLH